MYIELPYTHGRSPFYLVGKPGLVNKWAFNRMMARDVRRGFQTTVATILALVALAMLNVLSWYMGIVYGLVMIFVTFGLLVAWLIAFVCEHPVVPDVYDWLAETWFERASFQNRCIDIKASLSLRTLASQATSRQQDAELIDDGAVNRWLVQHKNWKKQIDALLRDKWLISAEKVRTDNAQSGDATTVAKLEEIALGVQALTWKLAQQIIAAHDAEVDVVQAALEDCLKSAPRQSSSRWQQPRRESNPRPNADLR